MQRIIQITIAGRMIPIEEDAYLILRDYLKSLDLLEIPSAEKNRQMLACNGKSWTMLRSTHQIMVEHGLFRGAPPTPELFNGAFLP